LTDLRVLFVSPVFRVDPYLRRLSGLIVRIARLVSEVEVITPAVEAGKIPQEIRVIQIPSLRTKRVFWPLLRPKKFLKAVRKEEGKFDIKHFFKIDYLTAWGVLACSEKKVLTVDNFPG